MRGDPVDPELAAQRRARYRARYGGSRDYLSRFWRRVRVGEESQCWEWAGAIFIGIGYGMAHGRKCPVGAHRVALETTRTEAIPSGQHARHLCHNRRCCNPAHLVAGTPKQNARDSVLAKAQPYQRGVLCKNMLHDMSLPGAYYVRKGRTAACRSCERATAKRHRERRTPEQRERERVRLTRYHRGNRRREVASADE
jgi:hypothetical protein